jgi:CRISPR-associated protein Cas2
MWVFALFDLPVVSREDRRNYTRFRNALLQDGFVMLQYSVYARYCKDEESAAIHKKRVRQALPPQGSVRILGVTDAQFGKMDAFVSRKRVDIEDEPEQMLLL